ncbi:MAG: OmpA family protein [Bdellovibrionaceae bacterium]|nr:OmpA family protein [Pseudobdellovibrionaceae bacterium]
MKKTLLLIIVTASAFVGCQTAKENPNASKGAGIGAAAGALAGAIIGHQSGQRDKGAALGAILGAGVGGLAGSRLDKQQKELEKIAETKRTEQGLVTQLKSDILFDTGKSALKPQATTNIKELATIMKKYPENIITVKGYTDNTGTDKVNKPLSEGRAKAVQAQLIEAGIPTSTVTAVGMGSNNPVDPGSTTAAKAKNRRVEIEIAVDESKIPKK